MAGNPTADWAGARRRPAYRFLDTRSFDLQADDAFAAKPRQAKAAVLVRQLRRWEGQPRCQQALKFRRIEALDWGLFCLVLEPVRQIAAIRSCIDVISPYQDSSDGLPFQVYHAALNGHVILDQLKRHIILIIRFNFPPVGAESLRHGSQRRLALWAEIRRCGLETKESVLVRRGPNGSAGLLDGVCGSHEQTSAGDRFAAGIKNAALDQEDLFLAGAMGWRRRRWLAWQSFRCSRRFGARAVLDSAMRQQAAEAERQWHQQNESDARFLHQQRANTAFGQGENLGRHDAAGWVSHR